jgi:hypothetical protein
MRSDSPSTNYGLFVDIHDILLLMINKFDPRDIDASLRILLGQHSNDERIHKDSEIEAIFVWKVVRLPRRTNYQRTMYIKTNFRLTVVA